MKKINPTNVVPGIIAAEVVLLTVKAFAGRLPDADKAFVPEGPSGPPKAAEPPFLVVGAFQRVIGLLRRWIPGAGLDTPSHTRRVRGRVGSHRPYDEEEEHSEDQADDHEGEIHLKGDMQGVAEKLKDPAWAGVLAANDGNISLTNAERAVPMPNSGKLVQRLDRNPYVGKGMKDHSRDPH